MDTRYDNINRSINRWKYKLVGTFLTYGSGRIFSIATYILEKTNYMTISKLFDKSLFFFVIGQDSIWPCCFICKQRSTVHRISREIHSNLLFKNCPCYLPCSWISSSMPNDSCRTLKSQWTYFKYVKIIFKSANSRWIILKISSRYAIAIFVYDYAIGPFTVKSRNLLLWEF